MPLLAAIRHFSDLVAWTEFERLLELDASAEERAGWNASDWARHDFQVSLKLDVARQRLSEGLPAMHRWAQLRTAFRARLQSGELVATGYVKPVRVGDGRIAIPADKWRFLQPDFRNSSAVGEGLKIVDVLVREATGVSSTAAETKCRHWLSSDPSAIVATVTPFNKGNVFHRARECFGHTLSRRAFDRAWSAAAPQDWKEPGAKKKE